MCGIAGKVDLTGDVSLDLLHRMCRTLEHRGPDARGIHAAGGVGLGVQRLAVIDLKTGDQPIYNEDGSIVVVLNGEIYNYLELREQLQARGHSFRTAGDTETIVHLYEELGVRCVDQLRGMFAFAIWDGRRQRLVLARDRVGKKPLFFSCNPNALWFASEPRAIFQDPSVTRAANFEAIDSYLRFQYVPHPLSAFNSLRKLPPAHVLTWSGGAPDISRYWKLDYGVTDEYSMDTASELVRESLLEATRIRLRSDVPLGAFLSGGVDSSAIVAAMAMEGTGQTKTFSIGFDVSDFDETPYARQVAERYGTDHHEFRVEADAINVLPRLVWHYGEPFADSSALPSFYLSELTRSHVTVALNGDGGDENFAGYSRYLAQTYAERIDVLPAAARRAIASAARRIGRGQGARTLRSRSVRALTEIGAAGWERYDRWMSYFTRADLERLYEPEFAAALQPDASADRLIEELWIQSTARNTIEKMQDVDVQSYLPGDLLVKMDIATMAHSLEVRSPFLDHLFMERMARLPAALKLRRSVPKSLLKEAVRPWLPDAVISRPKMGFGVPIASWFRGQLQSLPEEVLLDPSSTRRGMFRPGAIRQLIDEHRAGRFDHSSKLWSLLSLELWFRTYVDGSEIAVISLAEPGNRLHHGFSPPTAISAQSAPQISPPVGDGRSSGRAAQHAEQLPDQVPDDLEGDADSQATPSSASSNLDSAESHSTATGGLRRSALGRARAFVRRLPSAGTSLVCLGLLLQPIWSKMPVATLPVLTFGRLWLVVAALGVGVETLRRRTWPPRPSRSTLLLLGGLICGLLIAAISGLQYGTVRSGGAFYGYVEFVAAVLLLAWVASLHRRTWLPLLIAAAAGSLLSDIQALAAGTTVGARLTGGFGNPNYLAYTTATGTMILLSCWPFVRKRWRVGLLVVLLLPLATLALTYSRAGALILAAGGFVFIIQRASNHRIAVAAGALVLVTASVLLLSPVLQRLRAAADYSTQPDKSGWDPLAEGPIPSGPSTMSNTRAGGLRVTTDAAGSGVSYPLGTVSSTTQVSVTVRPKSGIRDLPLLVALEDNIRANGLKQKSVKLGLAARRVTLRWRPTADSPHARVYFWSPAAHARFVISDVLVVRRNVSDAHAAPPLAQAVSLRQLGSTAITLGNAFERRAKRSRQASAKFALQLFRDHPLAGVGWMRFGAYSRPRLGVYDAGSAHNQYLTILAELGIPGLLCLVLCGAALTLRLAREPLSPVQAAVLAPLAGALFGLLFMDAVVSTAVVLPLATLLAVLFASQSKTARTTNPHAPHFV